MVSIIEIEKDEKRTIIIKKSVIYWHVLWNCKEENQEEDNIMDDGELIILLAALTTQHHLRLAVVAAAQTGFIRCWGQLMESFVLVLLTMEMLLLIIGWPDIQLHLVIEVWAEKYAQT